MNITKQITFCAMLLTISITCTNSQIISGNGNVVKKERNVLPFTSIVTSNGWDLILTQGENYAMTIETDENLQDKVKTDVKDGVLTISSDAKITKSKERKIYLTFKELNSIKASGGCDVYAETIIATEKLELNLSGGSDLKGLNLNAKNFTGKFSGGSDAKISFEAIQHIDIDASGGSDMKLSKIAGETCRINLGGGSDASLDGSINKLELSASGGSDTNASDLNAKDAKVTLSGSSDGKMMVTGTLDLTLSGGSDFVCNGNPQITNKDVCKSCEVAIR